MSVEEIIVFLFVMSMVLVMAVGLAWYMSRLATAKELARLRHKVKNLVAAIKLAASTNDFPGLQYLNWKDLRDDEDDEDSAEDIPEHLRVPPAKRPSPKR